jgi:hypothetical protein
MCWYDINIFSEDSDPNDNGHEIERERNDDGGNDDDGDNDDGIFGALRAKFQEQMNRGQNRPRTTMLMAEI